MTCLAETPPSAEYVFGYSTYNSGTLYVPTGSVEAYKAVDCWKEFTNIVPFVRGDLTGSGTVDVDDLSLAIDMVLGKAEGSAAADLNGAGAVDVADVATLINIVLGK